MGDRPSRVEMVLYIVGALATGYGVIKAYIIGYYPSEEALMWGSLVGGVLALAAASAMGKSRKAKAIAARDRSRGVS